MRGSIVCVTLALCMLVTALYLALQPAKAACVRLCPLPVWRPVVWHAWVHHRMQRETRLTALARVQRAPPCVWSGRACSRELENASMRKSIGSLPRYKHYLEVSVGILLEEFVPGRAES